MLPLARIYCHQKAGTYYSRPTKNKNKLKKVIRKKRKAGRKPRNTPKEYPLIPQVSKRKRGKGKKGENRRKIEKKGGWGNRKKRKENTCRVTLFVNIPPPLTATVALSSIVQLTNKTASATSVNCTGPDMDSKLRVSIGVSLAKVKQLKVVLLSLSLPLSFSSFLYFLPLSFPAPLLFL